MRAPWPSPRLRQHARQHWAHCRTDGGNRRSSRLPCAHPAHQPLLRAIRNIYRMYHARSEEHTSELQSLMRISYAVFCLKKKNINEIESPNIQVDDTTKHREREMAMGNQRDTTTRNDDPRDK